VIVPGFQHVPGVHCGSTAVADALRTAGVSVSEPVAFGLGAGLGFFYLAVPGLTPSRFFQGRSARLELEACAALGVPAAERTAGDAAAALAGVRAALGRGISPILATDLSRLPYWRSRTPFGGHRVVLAGIDPGAGRAYLADTDRPGLEALTLDELDAARASVAPPFGAPGRPWIEVEPGATARPFAAVAAEAIRRQARDLLLDVDGAAGISALERFAAELPEWPARAGDDRDRVRCFRFAAQTIEVRGTGGGLFRRLYARFLRAVEEALPGLAPLGLPGRMEALADGWTALAAGLVRLAEEGGARVPAEVAAQARALAEGERRFFEDAAARVR
jgi:Domain of unknown function (DUF4872)/Butirosin biosynthesis protein H, N-terminal